MRKLKKIAAGLLTAVLALGMLTSCSSKSANIDVNVSAAKNWYASNTGKLLGTYNMLTYQDEGTEKYIVRLSSGSSGKPNFIGSKEYGCLNSDKVVSHAKKIYENDNVQGTTKFQASDVDKALWRLLSAEDLNWVLAGINTYEGKQYYTEVISGQFGGADYGSWLAKLDGRNSYKEYTFVFYYESEDASIPAFIRIDGQGLNGTAVSVSDLQGINYDDTVPAPYNSLLSATGYQEGTVTK